MSKKIKPAGKVPRRQPSKKSAAHPAASRKTLSATKIHRLQVRLKHRANELQKVNKLLHIEMAERKRAEQTLRENEEIFDRFLENSPIYVFFKDEHIRSVKLSRNYESMVGKPMAELLGKNMDELFPSELAKSMVADDRRILSEGKEIVVSEELNGRFYTTLKFPISIKGKPRFLAGYTIDITERKQAEEALRESEQKFRTLADSGRALIWAAGTDKLCNYFNRVWLEFTGRTIEQEMGNGWAEGVHTEDLGRCLNIYTEAFDRREAFSMEYRLRRYDGAFRWILDDGSPQYNSKGEFIGYIGHCLDVTNRKEAEIGLQKTTEEREKLIKELQYALDNVKTLQGLIPICANCKKVRDDKGYWNQVEAYIGRHTDATFTHGICPDCAKDLYGDVYERTKKK